MFFVTIDIVQNFTFNVHFKLLSSWCSTRQALRSATIPIPAPLNRGYCKACIKSLLFTWLVQFFRGSEQFSCRTDDLLHIDILFRSPKLFLRVIDEICELRFPQIAIKVHIMPSLAVLRFCIDHDTRLYHIPAHKIISISEKCTIFCPTNSDTRPSFSFLGFHSHNSPLFADNSNVISNA